LDLLDLPDPAKGGGAATSTISQNQKRRKIIAGNPKSVPTKTYERINTSSGNEKRKRKSGKVRGM
jgi:hypothetical protein